MSEELKVGDYVMPYTGKYAGYIGIVETSDKTHAVIEIRYSNKPPKYSMERLINLRLLEREGDKVCLD